MGDQLALQPKSTEILSKKHMQIVMSLRRDGLKLNEVAQVLYSKHGIVGLRGKPLGNAAVSKFLCENGVRTMAPHTKNRKKSHNGKSKILNEIAAIVNSNLPEGQQEKFLKMTLKEHNFCWCNNGTR